MKFTYIAVFAAAISASSLLAQTPTWAEQLHKTKTGVYPPGVEQRLKQEKEARLLPPKVQVTDLFAALDHNQDGTISAQEWQQATRPAEPEPKPTR